MVFPARKFQRACGLFISVFVLTLLLSATSCKKSGQVDNQSENVPGASGSSQETFSTPPFATKEPERYQALRITTNSAGGNAAEPVEMKKTIIARNGDRRREDYETANGTASFLQLSSGTYLLLPEQKVYAELKPEAGELPDVITTGSEPVLSPDRLLNEARPQSRYVRLGPETINGRETVKYRVTMLGAKEVLSEGLIWVDERLGMPVKSEMSSPDGAKFSTELSEIKETVDENVFNLPPDYKKVEAREIFALLSKARGGAGP